MESIASLRLDLIRVESLPKMPIGVLRLERYHLAPGGARTSQVKRGVQGPSRTFVIR